MLVHLLFQRCAPLVMLIIAFSIYSAAGESPSALHSVLELSEPLSSGWAVGDLNGDGETDVLVSREVGQSDTGYLYRVELKLSNSEGSGSFTFENTDALGVNIAAVDVDGDHDLDLIISDPFSRQRIGVWINDGKGSFTRNQHTFDSPPMDLLYQSLRLEVPTQAINENSSWRLHADVSRTRFIPPARFSIAAECGAAVDCKLQLPYGPACLRGPPNVPLLVIHF
jgi:hypothetical protein